MSPKLLVRYSPGRNYYRLVNRDKIKNLLKSNRISLTDLRI
uniref:Uncharacterized protein n=1 Tax=uncultured marine Nitrospinaceae bacterium TaxID=482920 RepID=A4GJ50_9BACT|nr:hypothetical protein [uncultured marine Nitrospinaceae bacterium]